MRFSLVMATVDRVEDLELFLASLRVQAYRDFELIVVDQNPDERLVPIVASYQNEYPVLHLKGERGLSKARNLGLEHAGGDIIAFPDDDCRYPPDLLERVARFFVDHPGIDGLNGRSVDESGETSMGRFDTRAGPIDKLNLWGRGIEYAVFLRAPSVRGVYFDEELGLGAGTAWGAGEGTDYLLELLERGASLHYNPALVVVHPSIAPPYDAKDIRKTYSYGCGMGRVLRKRKMPLRLKAKWLYRPLGGALLSLAGSRLSEARYRWNTFRGRLRGMLP